MKSLLNALITLGFLAALAILIGSNLPATSSSPSETQVVSEVGYRAAVRELGYLPSPEFPRTSVTAHPVAGGYRVQGQVMSDFDGSRSHSWSAYLVKGAEGWITDQVSLDD
jgi:hypothetical protein